MNSLPNETMLNILGFLPGKEAQRLKSACKRIGVLVNENPAYMRKIMVVMTVSDGFGKGGFVGDFPFELRVEVGRKEFLIYADQKSGITGNVPFCQRFARNLKETNKMWCYKSDAPIDPNLRRFFPFRNERIRDFVYQVNPNIVHSKEFSITVLFERMLAVMEIHELTVEAHMYPLMQHILGHVAKTTKFRIHTIILPVNPKSKEDECDRHEICRAFDLEKNKNSQILIYDPPTLDIFAVRKLNVEKMKAMNALGESYPNVFWGTDLENVYVALKDILTAWLSDELKELRFGFLILQGRKLNMWSTRWVHQWGRDHREHLHTDFVKEAMQLGVCSNYFDSEYDEWVDIDSLPDAPLEFYFGVSRTIRITFEKKDEETAIARLSMFYK